MSTTTFRGPIAKRREKISRRRRRSCARCSHPQVDIYVNFHLAYFDHESERFVYDLRKIQMHYAKHWFVCSFVRSFVHAVVVTSVVAIVLRTVTRVAVHSGAHVLLV